MSESFSLHDRLYQDTDFVTDLPLCRVLLAKDGRFPWLILVPRQEGLTEIIDLSVIDQHQLLAEINLCSQFLKQHLGAEKLNVAALGNMVAQLHIHIIARFQADPVWPAPIWGQGAAVARTEQDRDTLINACQAYLRTETSV